MLTVLERQIKIVRIKYVYCIFTITLKRIPLVRYSIRICSRNVLVFVFGNKVMLYVFGNKVMLYMFKIDRVSILFLRKHITIVLYAFNCSVFANVFLSVFIRCTRVCTCVRMLDVWGMCESVCLFVGKFECVLCVGYVCMFVYI